MRRREWQLGVAGVALAGGGLIYILFRPRAHRVLVWGDNMGLGGLLRALREVALRHGSPFPDWCVYSLPDGLWLFSMLTVMAVVWRRDRAMTVTAQAALTVATLGHELAQARWPTLGTYSLGDVVCYLAAASSAIGAVSKS